MCIPQKGWQRCLLMLGWTSTGFRSPRCPIRAMIGPLWQIWFKRIFGYWFSHPTLQRKQTKKLLINGDTWWKMSVSIIRRCNYVFDLDMLQWLATTLRFNGFQLEMVGWHQARAQTERNQSPWTRKVHLFFCRITFHQCRFKPKLARSIQLLLLIWLIPVIKQQGM